MIHHLERAAGGLPQRRSIRLPGYDYAGCGAYFVTMCAEKGRCLFGRVADDAMWPNALGEIVIREWLVSATLRPGVRLGPFVLMPNHMHGIVYIGAGDLPVAPTAGAGGHGGELPVAPTRAGPAKGSLGSLVGCYKAMVTRRARLLLG